MSKTFNILLLGETGTGKSTFINAFANYVSYSALEEAKAQALQFLVPIKFTLADTQEGVEEFIEHVIEIGEDKNEYSLEEGQSATQLPRSYVFRYKDTKLRIIDTPGMNDTRGIDQDKQNMQHIMNHISHYKELHAICILLIPNNARLSVGFRFCIKEILTNLHKDASKNIIFCFTNSRETNYKPGNTLSLLKKFLAQHEDVGIMITKNIIYYVDNESVRYLAAKKHGIAISEEEESNFSKSWKKSVSEIDRLLLHISTLDPHVSKNTTTINDFRRRITALSKPLAQISRTIQRNKHLAQEKNSEIQKSEVGITDLDKKLCVPIIVLRAKLLNHRRTVCTSPKCVQYFANDTEPNYIQHCHPHCHITGAPSNVINCSALRHCSAMDRSRTNKEVHCNVCSCSWTVHMHITYELYETKFDDGTIYNEPGNERNAVKMFLLTLKDRIEQLQKEQKQIIEVCAKFSFFLKTHAIADYNDAFSDYLDHLVAVEDGKKGEGDSKILLERLQEIREEYNEQLKIWSNLDIKNSKMPNEIEVLIESLCSMQLMGAAITEAMQIAELSSKQNYKQIEIVFNSPRQLSAQLSQQTVGLTLTSTRDSQRAMPDASMKYTDNVIQLGPSFSNLTSIPAVETYIFHPYSSSSDHDVATQNVDVSISKTTDRDTNSSLNAQATASPSAQPTTRNRISSNTKPDTGASDAPHINLFSRETSWATHRDTYSSLNAQATVSSRYRTTTGHRISSSTKPNTTTSDALKIDHFSSKYYLPLRTTPRDTHSSLNAPASARLSARSTSGNMISSSTKPDTIRSDDTLTDLYSQDYSETSHRLSDIATARYVSGLQRQTERDNGPAQPATTERLLPVFSPSNRTPKLHKHADNETIDQN